MTVSQPLALGSDRSPRMHPTVSSRLGQSSRSPLLAVRTYSHVTLGHKDHPGQDSTFG